MSRMEQRNVAGWWDTVERQRRSERRVEWRDYRKGSSRAVHYHLS